MKTWEKYFKLENKMKDVAIRVLSAKLKRRLSKDCNLIKESYPHEVDPDDCCLFKLIDESYRLVGYVDQDWFDMTDEELAIEIKSLRIEQIENEIDSEEWQRDRLRKRVDELKASDAKIDDLRRELTALTGRDTVDETALKEAEVENG